MIRAISSPRAVDCTPVPQLRKSLLEPSHSIRRQEQSPSGELPHLGTLAIVGRPNVGKSTLFNRLTGSRRSIVGDEPGITRDRIYGEIEWDGRDARIVDTGGIVPDDEALIPSEIFRQARVALDEADAIVMVVDGRTELASPDLDLARLLLRDRQAGRCSPSTKSTPPKLDAARRKLPPPRLQERLPDLRRTRPGIGDLLDAVFAADPPKHPKSPPPNRPHRDDELGRRRPAPTCTEPAGQQSPQRQLATRD